LSKEKAIILDGYIGEDWIVLNEEKEKLLSQIDVMVYQLYMNGRRRLKEK